MYCALTDFSMLTSAFIRKHVTPGNKTGSVTVCLEAKPILPFVLEFIQMNYPELSYQIIKCSLVISTQES